MSANFRVDIDQLEAALMRAINKTIVYVERIQDTVVVDFSDGTRMKMGPPE